MFDLKTWDGFTQLSKEGLDYLLDTTSLNKKMKDRAGNPYRWRVGTFRIPVGITKEIAEKYSKSACDKFICSQEKQGWQLVSKLQVYGPYRAYDLANNVLLLDQQELRVRGIFAINSKPVRIEIPAASVKQTPDHKVTLEEAIINEGITVVPLKEKIKSAV